MNVMQVQEPWAADEALRALRTAWRRHVERYGLTMSFQEYQAALEASGLYRRFLGEGGASAVGRLQPSVEGNAELHNLLREAREKTASDDPAVLNGWVRGQLNAAMGISVPVAGPAVGEHVSREPSEPMAGRFSYVSMDGGGFDGES